MKLCECGECEEAVDKAVKFVCELIVEPKCAVYVYAVGTALQKIGQALYTEASFAAMQGKDVVEQFEFAGELMQEATEMMNNIDKRLESIEVIAEINRALDLSRQIRGMERESSPTH